MELRKQFTFSGIFKKFHEEDDHPIEISDAKIYCYTNGTLLIEIDFEVNEAINEKKFYEYAPTYRFKGIASDQLDIMHFLQSDQFETEVVQSPYEGDYEIEGKTVEGWKIKAIVSNVGFKVGFTDESTKKKHEDKYKVRLEDLCIDYALHLPREEKTQEIVYGLANIEVFHKFLAKIGNLEAEVYIESVSTEEGNKSGALSAEMTLRNICENEQDSYENYYSWLISLLSFASGHYISQVYKIETIKSKDLQMKSEYWSGGNPHGEARGLAVIQSPHLSLFIQQCTKQMTWENFNNRGVGLALNWYLHTFTSTVVEVNFLLLCTVLESLNKKHSSNFSKRLISKKIYKQLRETILRLVSDFRQNVDNKDDLEKYDIFALKVGNSFASGSYNQIGDLRTSLKEMFEAYSVPYESLFPELEFIKLRDNIVHKGFSGINAAIELRKLSNLVVRVFLAILEYQGDYMESRKIEMSDKSGQSKHGLICKSFPFISSEKSVI